MADLKYPYQTYIPSKTIAGCTAGIVSISLIAWFIQSFQTRFQPRRLCILLLISHTAICIELIVRAALNDQANSQTIFTVFTSLFAIGQRMIIVSNFSFVLQIHCVQTRTSRGILIGAVACVVTSGLLMAPANLFSFDPNKTDSSFVFRKLSSSVLFIVTIAFYIVLYWSKTIKDMTIQALTLIIISSTLCFIVALFNLIQSISIDYYEEFNNYEGWFYALEMIPIILAHFTWSIFHPKRSLKSNGRAMLDISSNMSVIDKQPILNLRSGE